MIITTPIIFQPDVENMNRRTAEPQNKKPQNIEVKDIVLFLSKTSAVRNSLFDIVLRTPHPAGESPVSIFQMQKRLHPAPIWTEALGFQDCNERGGIL